MGVMGEKWHTCIFSSITNFKADISVITTMLGMQMQSVMMSQSMNVSLHGFGRLFQKDVVERAIGRRDEDGEA